MRAVSRIILAMPRKIFIYTSDFIMVRVASMNNRLYGKCRSRYTNHIRMREVCLPLLQFTETLRKDRTVQYIRMIIPIR